MVEPAPGRFSTITCWPRLADIDWPVSRAMVSIGPPGGKGTIILIGLSGEGWWPAVVAMPAQSAKPTASSACLRIMGASLVSFVRVLTPLEATFAAILRDAPCG